MSEDELRKYYTMYTDCWRWIKKYLASSDKQSNEFWDNLSSEAHDIWEKYGESEIVMDILLAGITEIHFIGAGMKWATVDAMKGHREKVRNGLREAVIGTEGK